MNHNPLPGHLSAEQIQAFLDGELSKREHAGAEEHLRVCARCSAELAAWGSLFDAVRDLPVLVPGRGFSDRVLSGLAVNQPIPLAARVRESLAAMLASESERHVRGPALQDYLDGLVPDDVAVRVDEHLAGCPACAGEVASWHTLLGQLDGMPTLAPSEGFAQRVMEGVRVPKAQLAPRRVPEWRRALAAFGRLVPKTQQAWAALSGVAVTPVVTLGLVLWTLFTHPTLTPGALASFAWWKISDAAAVAWQTVASAAMESSGLFGIFSLVESLSLSPLSLLGAFLALSAGTVAATWVLYRNLLATHPADGRYAHAPLS